MLRVLFSYMAIHFIVMVNAQSILTNSFDFVNGYYTSMQELQQNKPAIPWAQLEASYYENRKEYELHISGLYNADHEIFEPDTLFAVVVDGRPYIYTGQNEFDALTFSGLRLRGRICYYEYDVQETIISEIKAYNPATGIPFRSQKVENVNSKSIKMMLNFETGEQAILNANNLKEWVKADQKLYNTLKETKSEDLEQKLLKSLLIYLDRNPLFLPLN